MDDDSYIFDRLYLPIQDAGLSLEDEDYGLDKSLLDRCLDEDSV